MTVDGLNMMTVDGTQRDEGESLCSAYFSLISPKRRRRKKNVHATNNVHPPTFSHRKSLATRSEWVLPRRKEPKTERWTANKSPHILSFFPRAFSISSRRRVASCRVVVIFFIISILNIFPPSGFTLGLPTEGTLSLFFLVCVCVCVPFYFFVRSFFLLFYLLSFHSIDIKSAGLVCMCVYTPLSILSLLLFFSSFLFFCYYLR